MDLPNLLLQLLEGRYQLYQVHPRILRACLQGRQKLEAPLESVGIPGQPLGLHLSRPA
ncbi:MAG: hypothetical protein ABR985_22555 [Methanotrichaceae archaeon]